MNVLEYLKKTISRDGAVHLTLIDPDEQTPEEAGYLARLAKEARTDGIMIGGSTKAGGEKLHKTVERIKTEISLPTILFPANEGGISRNADAIFFMSLLNSSNPFYITGAQCKGAPIVKKFDIEPISLAYLIVEPGGTVGRVGEADLIERNEIERATGYALAAQYLGMNSVYLEAGSGAEKPIPTKMIESVRDNVDTLLIVGGGIDSAEAAEERTDAGADIIVTGTIIEKAENKSKKIKSLVNKIKN
ncbi:MAG: geranylgeranylglyceryl/heptaprenylglyceryl phosphate synthase [Candidatus Hadarchaeia archaeon]